MAVIKGQLDIVKRPTALTLSIDNIVTLDITNADNATETKDPIYNRIIRTYVVIA